MKQQVAKTLLIGPALVPEQFVPEHCFFYLVTGRLDGYYGTKSYTLRSGEYGIVRKNYLGRYTEQRELNRLEKVIFVFDEPFLKDFQEKHEVTAAKFKSAESFLRLANNKLINNFLHSLIAYYDSDGKIDKAFFNIKREELLLILLHIQPELSGLFFNYAVPEKTDLEAFMNGNYKFNVSVERFAYLTGRSLSAFKRDFKTVFNQTPNRWLVQKRLQEAYFLIDQKNKKPSEIYLDLGFEDLSHFSFAFKKRFGLRPTELINISNHMS
jgi:AraC family transcriptional regulator, exoenzyme S synthesis regulatory protein ExsA